MKKLILCLAAAVVSLTAAADEGMWLLPYLQKMNIGDMKAKGCQLTAEDIYSVNHGSLKDAIVIFGNGCTGEVGKAVTSVHKISYTFINVFLFKVTFKPFFNKRQKHIFFVLIKIRNCLLNVFRIYTLAVKLGLNTSFTVFFQIF